MSQFLNVQGCKETLSLILEIESQAWYRWQRESFVRK